MSALHARRPRFPRAAVAKLPSPGFGTGPNKPVTLHLLQNLKLDELVAKNLGEFAFIMEPLKIQGATGSTVTPVAVL